MLNTNIQEMCKHKFGTLGAEQVFSPATRAQLELGARVADQLAGKNLTEIDKTMRLCLDQNPEWKQAAKAAVVGVLYSADGYVSPVARAQREAFNSIFVGAVSDAETTLRNVINSTSGLELRGWLKQQLAAVINTFDQVEAQKLQKSAISDNKRLLKPMEGIEYEALKASQVDQATSCFQFLQNFKAQPNKLVVHAQSIIDRLKFQPDSADSFEGALQEVGTLF